MSKHYRIIFETYDPFSNQQDPLSRTLIMDDSIEKPTSIFNLGFNHEKQVSLIQAAQDSLRQRQVN